LKKTLLLKILYYIFFAVIIFIALIIFMEIIDFPFYDQYLSGFFRNMIRFFEF